MTGNIYISGQIGTFDGTPGVELIDVIGQVKKQPKATAFNVHINSEGGLVDVGFDIYHYLKSLGKPITTIGTGIVASIATVIFMAGEKRLIRENTPFMVHLPWGGSMGTADELEQFAGQLRTIEKKMVSFYKKALNTSEAAILPLLVILINKDDIDTATTTTDATNRILVTNLQLKPGKTGHLLTGVKQSNGKAWELVKKENAPDKFKHTFSGVIFNPGAANKQQADSLSKGAKYIVVIEQIWKGIDSDDAFEILGLSSGLELTTMTNNSRENDNMIMFELASADGYEETTMPRTLLDGDYAATKTAFTNKFAQAAS